MNVVRLSSQWMEASASWRWRASYRGLSYCSAEALKESQSRNGLEEDGTAERACPNVRGSAVLWPLQTGRGTILRPRRGSAAVNEHPGLFCSGRRLDGGARVSTSARCAQPSKPPPRRVAIPAKTSYPAAAPTDRSYASHSMLIAFFYSLHLLLPLLLQSLSCCFAVYSSVFPQTRNLTLPGVEMN